MELNSSLFTLVNQGSGQWPALDYFFVAITSWGSYLIPLAVFLFFFIIPSARSAKKDFTKRAFEATLTLVCTLVIVYALKTLVAHPRPFVLLPEIDPLVGASPFRSFPSAHAALTMALAISVLPHRRHLGHLLIAFALVVGLSRLYVGVHYPLDVVAGLLIGYVVPKTMHGLFKKEAKI